MELFSAPGGQRPAGHRPHRPRAGRRQRHRHRAGRPQPPAHLQKRAIVWGTVGAMVVRSTMTIGVVWLLKIPGLMLVGGLGLV